MVAGGVYPGFLAVRYRPRQGRSIAGSLPITTGRIPSLKRRGIEPRWHLTRLLYMSAPVATVQTAQAIEPQKMRCTPTCNRAAQLTPAFE